MLDYQIEPFQILSVHDDKIGGHFLMQIFPLSTTGNIFSFQKYLAFTSAVGSAVVWKLLLSGANPVTSSPLVVLSIKLKPTNCPGNLPGQD